MRGKKRKKNKEKWFASSVSIWIFDINQQITSFFLLSTCRRRPKTAMLEGLFGRKWIEGSCLPPTKTPHLLVNKDVDIASIAMQLSYYRNHFIYFFLLFISRRPNTTMLEGLFGDENEDGTASSSSKNSPSGSKPDVSSPPSPRLPCGLAGIKNQGATCYMNALLQSLLYTPEFRGMFVCLFASWSGLALGAKDKGLLDPLKV